MNVKKYYKEILGEHSLYWWAERMHLNSYEFDILKRLLRPGKGQVKSDIKKTIDLIDIYVSEHKQIRMRRIDALNRDSFLVSIKKKIDDDIYEAVYFLLNRDKGSKRFVETMYVIKNILNSKLKDL